jgi:hypothetical protein
MFKLSFFKNYNNDDFFSALTILKDNLPRQENGSDFLGIVMDSSQCIPKINYRYFHVGFSEVT